MTAKEHLINHGIRPSIQRMAVMQYLMDHCTHPTVDEIYVNLVSEIPTLSRTTVYNTLELLVAHRAVLEITIEGGKAHYDGRVTPHSHFFCNECKNIYDIEVDAEKLKAFQPSRAYLVESTQLNYTGICPHCRNKIEN